MYPTVSAAVLPMAEAFFWCRDMINTPAEDMGPQDLAAEAAALAAAHIGELPGHLIMVCSVKVAAAGAGFSEGVYIFSRLEWVGICWAIAALLIGPDAVSCKQPTCAELGYTTYKPKWQLHVCFPASCLFIPVLSKSMLCQRKFASSQACCSMRALHCVDSAHCQT